MTELIPPAARTGGLPDDLPTRWAPTFTERQAVRELGIPAATYRRSALHAKVVADHHQAFATPRAEWEPQASHVERITGPGVDEASAQLVADLDEHVAPELEAIAQANTEAHAVLREAEAPQRQLVTKETRTTYSVQAAADRAEEHSLVIERDTAEGRTLHDRHRVLWWIGLVAPWADALGLWAFVSFVLDVDIARPMADPLLWLWSVVVVLGFGAGAAFLAPLAGRAHNAARDAAAGDRQREAETSATRRNWYLAVVVVLGLASTVALIARTKAVSVDLASDVAALDTVTMILLAVGVGMLMPALAYLGHALDGSKRSRELADLTKQLDASLTEHEERIAEAGGILDDADRRAAAITTDLYPKVTESVQRRLTEAHADHELTRDLVGGLIGLPSPVPPRVLDRSGPEVTGHLATGVPGARVVDLQPLFDRETRRMQLLDESAGLRERLDALPEHPWRRE